jgi:hypothetical protein
MLRDGVGLGVTAEGLIEGSGKGSLEGEMMEGVGLATADGDGSTVSACSGSGAKKTA